MQLLVQEFKGSGFASALHGPLCTHSLGWCTTGACPFLVQLSPTWVGRFLGFKRLLLNSYGDRCQCQSPARLVDVPTLDSRPRSSETYGRLELRVPVMDCPPSHQTLCPEVCVFYLVAEIVSVQILMESSSVALNTAERFQIGAL